MRDRSAGDEPPRLPPAAVSGAVRAEMPWGPCGRDGGSRGRGALGAAEVIPRRPGEGAGGPRGAGGRLRLGFPRWEASPLRRAPS